MQQLKDKNISSDALQYFTCGVGVFAAGSSEPTKYNTWVSLKLNEPSAISKFCCQKKKALLWYITPTPLWYFPVTLTRKCVYLPIITFHLNVLKVDSNK